MVLLEASRALSMLPWLVLLLLSHPTPHLCLLQQELQGGDTTPQPTKKNLTLLSLLPYPAEEGEQQPSWDEGYTLFITEQMAVDRLNNNSNLLPGYHVVLARSDSGCNIKSRATLSVIRDTLYSQDPIMGLVGPGCSGSASTVGPLTGRGQIALINVHIAGSLLLADRDVYPFSFGTLDSTEVFVETLLSLIDTMEWENVSALYDESRLYYYSTLQLMEDKIQGRDSFDYFSSAVYNTHIPLNIIQNHYRVVLLFVGPDFLSRILCMALKREMVYPIYQFVIVSRTAEEITDVTFMYENRLVSCNAQEMLKIKDNAIIIHYQLKPIDETKETDSGLSYAEFAEIYEQKVEEFEPPEDTTITDLTIEPSFWAPSYFDAVWSLGLALNNSMDTVNLSTYQFGQIQESRVIQDRLEELDYEGVSGRIWFNASTGYVQRNVDIYQINSSGSMENIGFYNRFERTINLSRRDKIVTGEFEHTTIILTAPKPLGIIVLLITAMGFIMVLTMQILTLRYRRFKSIKASSPKISQLAFIGCYIQVLGCIVTTCIDVYTDQISPQTNCILWHVLNIAAAIGTTLIFGTVCARTWRLYRIFVHFKDPGKFVSERFLILCVILFVAADVAISTIWIAVDPFRECVEVHHTNYKEVVGSEGVRNARIRVTSVVIHNCKQNFFVVWCVLLMLINVVFMGGAVVLAFLTRHIPYRDFKTRGIMSLTYILTAILGLGFSLYTILLTQQSYTVIVFRFVVVSVLLNVYIYLSCVLLFLPPLWPLLKLKMKGLRKRWDAMTW